MANTLRIKRRAAGGAAGAPASLENAELAFNEQDLTLYYGFGTGGAGGSATSIIPIAGAGAFAALAGNQSIDGVKTFLQTIQGSISGNAATASALAAARTLSMTGDATWSVAFDGSTNVSGALTLANSGVTAGSYGSASAVPVLTIDAKGRVTAASTASISGALTFTGDVTGSGTTGSSTALTLANSGVTAGTYTKVTVDAKGRVTVGASLASSDVTTALGFTPYNASNPNGYTSNTGTVTSVALSLPAIFSVTGSPVTTSGTLTAALASQTANTVWAAPNGSNGAPTFRLLAAADIPELTLEKLPDAWVKRSVRVATTANITLSGTQTIDGVAVVAGDRVLVKDQTTAAENGIYVVAAGAWSRAADANAASELASATVGVDSGTANGGITFDTDFKSTDTLGTTAMSWFRVMDTGLASASNPAMNGTVAIGTSINYARADHVHPVDTSRAPAAGSTSITTLGTITSGTWQATIINSTYGGTGVNNGGRTLAVNTNSGTLAFTNASTTLTIANNASVSGTNTGDQTITLTGDVTGSGTGSFAATLANSGVTAGTYTKVTVDAKGRVTVGATLVEADVPTLTAAKISNFDTQVRTSRLDQMAAPTAIVSLNSQRISNLADPVNAQDAATKNYVDLAVQGLDPKASVRAASTANIAALSGTMTIDGVALIAGDRVLVKDQTTASQNGIYVVAAGAWARAADADSWAELPGAYVFVEQGTINADNGFLCTVDQGGTLGTTNITFVQFNGAGQVIAGNGLTKTGNQIDVVSANSGRIVVNADNIDLATVGTAGTYRSVTTDAYGRVTAGTNPTTLAGYGITDAQPLDATLTALAGVTTAADRLIYATGADAFTVTTFTAFARTLLDDADAATARGTLGLGTMATQSAASVAITGGSITGLTTFDGITIDGGTF